MVEIIRDLEESGATTADIIAIFGKRAGPAMSALIGQGSDALQEFIDKLEDVDGITEFMAGVRMKGLTGAWKEFISAVQGLIIKLGDAGLLFILTKVVQLFTQLFRVINKVAEAIGILGKVMGFVAGGLVFGVDNLAVALLKQRIEAEGLENRAW